MPFGTPDCYDCLYRCDIPGDAHSCCTHPATKNLIDNPLAQIMGIFASVGRVSPILADCGLHIQANLHGIRKGWFNWPINYDPSWLEACAGFTKKYPDKISGIY